MRLAWALALVAATVLAGCRSAPAASSSPSPKPSLSPAASPIPSALPTAAASPSPTDQPFATRVNCTHPYNSTHGVALVSYAGAISVLDVSNGLKPFLLCWFSPAQGAAFDQAANHVVFWAGNHLGAIRRPARNEKRATRPSPMLAVLLLALLLFAGDPHRGPSTQSIGAIQT